MRTLPPRVTLGIALACALVGPRRASADFTLATVASLASNVGASPYGLAPDGQGGFIGSTQSVTFADETSYIATGFQFNPKTGVVTRQLNPGISTWLPDGQGNYYATTPYGGQANTGYLIRYNAAANTTQYVADFGTIGASSANNDLMFDGQGHIVGTSAYGGTSGNGTIFSYDLASRKLTTLVNFGPTTGFGVNGHLVSDGLGHLFGTSYVGGATNQGTVFRVDLATDTVSTLASFTGGNGSLPSTGLVADGHGGFLGTTGFGGLFNDGTVFRVDPATNSVTTLSSFAGTNGTRPTTTLVADGHGGFLGTTAGGSVAMSANGTVFDVDPLSGALTTVGYFSGRTSRFGGVAGTNPSPSIVADGQGNFYGTTFSGGANNLGTIFEITYAPNAIPEPSSILLTGGLLIGAVAARRVARATRVALGP